MSSPFRRGALLAALSLCLALAACGGGTSNQYSGSTLDGQVLMDSGAAVSGSANVCLYAVANGLGNPLNTSVTPAVGTGTLLTSGCISTDGNGRFVQALPNFYGPVLVQIIGGSYTNYASKAAASLTNLSTTNASLQALAFSGGGGTVNVVVSPLTTIATAIAQNLPGGLSQANYATAVARVQSEFQLPATSVTSAPAAGDAQDLVLRGVEYYLANLGTADPNAINLLTWTNPSTLSANFTTAYDTVNSSTTQFTFQ